MRHLFLLLFFCGTFSLAFAQDSLLSTKSEYLIALINSRELSKKATVSVDNGERIEWLKDERGNRMVFPTTAAALNYLSDRGWELFISQKTDAIQNDKVHYIFRRKTTR